MRHLEQNVRFLQMTVFRSAPKLPANQVVLKNLFHVLFFIETLMSLCQMQNILAGRRGGAVGVGIASVISVFHLNYL